MAYVAKKDSLMLMILEDNEPKNPRRYFDNIGRMVCWHSRYNLGDEHDYSEPYSFFQEYLYENESYDTIIRFARESNFIDISFERKDNGYEIYHRETLDTRFYKYEFIEGNLKDIKEELALSLLAVLPLNELKRLFEKHNLMLPLYLYDHSGITMNTTGFHCPWDSWQVGFIYMNHKDIEKNYGTIKTENIERAKTVLENEVSIYDFYLTGQVYGYKYFENGLEKDSCWGFYGEPQNLKGSISEFLPEYAQDLVEDLIYIDEYETDHYEEEYEEKYEMEESL